MKQEYKELLLKYLCMALPYGVKILHEGWNYEWDDELSTVERVVGIDEKFIYTKVIDTHNGEEYREDSYSIDLFDDKPYLRPMSSMTDEEKDEMHNLLSPEGTAIYGCDGISMPMNHYGEFVPYEFMIRIIQYLLEHHFDFMGLIPKNLAIEVSEDNNPYESNM